MLAVTVPLGEGELPSSFCSRLALRNGCRSAQDFCKDVGITFREIVNGVPEALEALAELGGVSTDSLSASAMRRTGDGYTIGKEYLGRVAIRWSSLLVCPACLAEDTVSWRELGVVAPYVRTVWQISCVLTCGRHDLKLVDALDADVSIGARGLRRHDTARLIEASCVDKERSSRRLSPLERYVTGRLAGQSGGNWLDHFPLHAAARASEIVGSVVLHGPKMTVRTMNDDARYQAGAAGYQILSGGPDNFRSFLLERRTDKRRSTGDPGVAALFGQLYNWLAYETHDPGYQAFREIMREVALDSLALEAGEKIFGQPVGRRRLHSIYSAAVETGICRPTMRTFLREAGFVRKEDFNETDDNVLIPVDDRLSQFLVDLKGAMTFSNACDYIGATRRQMELLVEGGFVSALNPDMKSHNKYSFAQRELDRFLAALLKGAVRTRPWEEGLVSIATAASQAVCRSVDVVALIVQGQLPTIRFTREAVGYKSVLVRVEEVKDVRNRRPLWLNKPTRHPGRGLP